MKKTLTLGVTVLLFFSLITTLHLSQKNQDLRGKASTAGQEIKLFLFPKEIKEIKGRSFSISPKITGPENKKIGSILLSFHFNKNHLQVINIQKNTQEKKIQLLKSTSLIQANSSGVMKLLIGAKDDNNAPYGVVNLPNIDYLIISDDISTVSVEKSESQIVFTNKDIADIDVEERVSVSSVITPTLIPSPSPTVTRIPVASTTPAITVTVSPAPTIEIPTITPSPTPVIPLTSPDG